MASLIGYVRVSSTDQSTAVQVSRLEEAGRRVIRREKARPTAKQRFRHFRAHFVSWR